MTYRISTLDDANNSVNGIAVMEFHDLRTYLQVQKQLESRGKWFMAEIVPGELFSK